MWNCPKVKSAELGRRFRKNNTMRFTHNDVKFVITYLRGGHQSWSKMFLWPHILNLISISNDMLVCSNHLQGISSALTPTIPRPPYHPTLLSIDPPSPLDSLPPLDIPSPWPCHPMAEFCILLVTIPWAGPPSLIKFHLIDNHEVSIQSMPYWYVQINYRDPLRKFGTFWSLYFNILTHWNIFRTILIDCKVYMLV